MRSHLAALPPGQLEDFQKGSIRVGVVFQQFNLFPHLTVLDNLCLAPVVVRRRNRAEVALHGSAHFAVR